MRCVRTGKDGTIWTGSDPREPYKVTTYPNGVSETVHAGGVQKFNPANESVKTNGNTYTEVVGSSNTHNRSDEFKRLDGHRNTVDAHANVLNEDESQNPIVKWFEKLKSYAAMRAQAPGCQGSYPGEMCGTALTKPETGTRADNPALDELKQNKDNGLTPKGNSIPLSQIAGSAIKCIGGVITFITGLVGNLISMVLGGVQMLTNLIIGAVQNVVSLVTAPLMSALNDLTLGITNLLESGANSFNIAGNVNSFIQNATASKFGCILSAFSGIGDFFGSLFSALGTALFKATSTFVKSAINIITKLAQAAFNALFGSILTLVKCLQDGLASLNKALEDALEATSPSSYGMKGC